MKNLVWAIGCMLISVQLQGQQIEWGNWTTWGDLGDGTYRNPIIPSDYSDIDCIEVDGEYYAISSTFQFSPGMTVLYSKDLVNWEICGNAVSDLTQIGENLNWNRMKRYGRGQARCAIIMGVSISSSALLTKDSS